MTNMIRREGRITAGPKLLAALGCFLLVGVGARAQTLATRDSLDQVNYPVKGPAIFLRYCAACHGSDAKGNGPVAPALKVKVPDLTILARNNRGQFPSARVRGMIMGDQVVVAHGSPAMPVWGLVFSAIEKGQKVKNIRLENLLQYLESIQQN